MKKHEKQQLISLAWQFKETNRETSAKDLLMLLEQMENDATGRKNIQIKGCSKIYQEDLST